MAEVARYVALPFVAVMTVWRLANLRNIPIPWAVCNARRSAFAAGNGAVSVRFGLDDDQWPTA